MNHKLLGIGLIVAVMGTAMAAPGSAHQHKHKAAQAQSTPEVQTASDALENAVPAATVTSEGSGDAIQSEVISRVPTATPEASTPAADDAASAPR
ncbi:hypothetical protein [Snodgrassella sp. CFCC 13594]|uniref:hypothetical protein n=1 Tax=Snodgrassella sp. CFCC 13594 TaxID=1775559 RepID=UPI000831EC85|nr:hypothetical protein [Snodgrassella sp. CFCC 13594]